MQKLKRKYKLLLICRESKRCRTWCRSKYVEQSCVDLEQRLVEAARAGAVTPMINSLPATWHRQIHHQNQNWNIGRQKVVLLTNWHLQIQHHYRSIKAVCVEGWDKFKLSNFSLKRIGAKQTFEFWQTMVDYINSQSKSSNFYFLFLSSSSTEPDEMIDNRVVGDNKQNW